MFRDNPGTIRTQTSHEVDAAETSALMSTVSFTSVWTDRLPNKKEVSAPETPPNSGANTDEPNASGEKF